MPMPAEPRNFRTRWGSITLRASEYQATDLPPIEAGGVKSFLHRHAGWVDGVAKTMTASTAALLKAPVNSTAIYGQALQTWQGSAWWIILSCSVVSFLIERLKTERSHLKDREIVQEILSGFRDSVFSEHLSDPPDRHRATIYKYERRRGRLVAFARSGHLSHSRVACFHSPDDPEACQGVVGLAWRDSSSIGAAWRCVPKGSGLLNPPSRNSSKKIREKYAKDTNVSTAWVDARLQEQRPFPKAIAALSITLHGQPWGVVVVDSQTLPTIDHNKLELWTTYGKLLRAPLERLG